MSHPKRSLVHNRAKLEHMHTEYMQSDHAIDVVARKYGVGHNNLRNAFKAAGLPIKNPRNVNIDEVKQVQAELGAPADYIAARYDVTDNTARTWLRRRPAAKNYKGFHAQHWWRAIMEECRNDPNEFFAMMIGTPHFMTPHRIPPVFHKHARPKGLILWSLNMPDAPAEYVHPDNERDVRYETMPDNAYIPQLYLGEGKNCTAVQWTPESIAANATTPVAALDEEYDAEDSMDDIDLEALAADLGIDL